MKNNNVRSYGKKQDKSKNLFKHDDSPFNPVKSETALWRAVITQALMDAGSASKKPEAIHEKAEAIRWLTGYSEDFVTVCLNADLDPGYVHSKAKEALARGCAWRRGMESRGINAPIEFKQGIKKAHTHLPALSALPHAANMHPVARAA